MPLSNRCMYDPHLSTTVVSLGAIRTPSIGSGGGGESSGGISPALKPTLLVYDFGGGTFDTAVIRINPPEQDKSPGITVLSADGEPFCGGTDIDKALAKYIATRIAQEYFNNNSALITQIAEELRNYAPKIRDTKEILSNSTESSLVLPSDFMDKPGIEIRITREQFETVLMETHLLEKTTNCVLRAWRKARMVYRKEDEVSGQFYLKIDHDTGAVSKHVTELYFDDLKQNVGRILLVGGTTKIPLIQKRLASILDGSKFISENDPYEPIVACSLGAAWRKQNISSIIDRLPFSIVISQGKDRQEMYRAYTPTVTYKTLTDQPRIQHYISSNMCTVSDHGGPAHIECVKPDGAIVQQNDVPSGKHVVEIDFYGRILLEPGMEEIPNPVQHELQKAQLRSIREIEERKKTGDEERLRKQLFKKPGEDYSTDVG